VFDIKQKYLDHLNGFSLSFLAALPVIRTDLINAPIYILLVPTISLFISGILKVFLDRNKYFHVNVITYVLSILILFIFLISSIYWSKYQIYTYNDIINVLFIIVISLSILISFNIRSVFYFLKWMVIFSVFGTLLLFNQYIQIGDLRGYGITGYLTKAQLIGLGAIIAFCKLLFDKKVNKKLYLFLTFFLFLGLALSLSRGALLSAVLIAIFICLYYFYTNKTKSFSILEWFQNKSTQILSVGFVGIIIFASLQIERTAHRLTRLFTGGELAGPRAELWSNSVTGFLEFPIIGYGIGNSGIISSGVEGYYPHNLFLQVMLDGGIIALIVLMFICLFPYFRTIQLLLNSKLSHSYFWIPLIGCFSFLFLEYSKSSDFYSARIFVSLGLVLVIVIESLKKASINR